MGLFAAIAKGLELEQDELEHTDQGDLKRFTNETSLPLREQPGGFIIVPIWMFEGKN